MTIEQITVMQTFKQNVLNQLINKKVIFRIQSHDVLIFVPIYIVPALKILPYSLKTHFLIFGNNKHSNSLFYKTFITRRNNIELVHRNTRYFVLPTLYMYTVVKCHNCSWGCDHCNNWCTQAEAGSLLLVLCTVSIKLYQNVISLSIRINLNVRKTQRRNLSLWWGHEKESKMFLIQEYCKHFKMISTVHYILFKTNIYFNLFILNITLIQCSCLINNS